MNVRAVAGNIFGRRKTFPIIFPLSLPNAISNLSIKIALFSLYNEALMKGKQHLIYNLYKKTP